MLSPTKRFIFLDDKILAQPKLSARVLGSEHSPSSQRGVTCAEEQVLGGWCHQEPALQPPVEIPLRRYVVSV